MDLSSGYATIELLDMLWMVVICRLMVCVDAAEEILEVKVRILDGLGEDEKVGEMKDLGLIRRRFGTNSFSWLL